MVGWARAFMPAELATTADPGMARDHRGRKLTVRRGGVVSVAVVAVGSTD
jgi:hypothetical protein